MPAGPETPPKKRTFTYFKVLVWIGVIALAAFAGYKYHISRSRKPVPPPVNPLPPISQAEQAIIREGMRIIGRTVLDLTPDQEKQLAAVWQRFPTTLDELADHTRKVDAILTPRQRAIVKPIRRGVRNRVIDNILAPARDHLSPEDFEKFKNAVKARVDARVEGAP